MPEMWINRLTVIGPQYRLKRFQESNWNRHLKAIHGELLENSPGRIAWQFESPRAVPDRLRQLSRRWPKLIFLLDHEQGVQRKKGFVKAQAGQIAHFQFDY